MVHPPRPRQRAGQHGAVLLEALVAILVFSLGILGFIGLQAVAIQQSGDALYRAEAAQLVDQLMGEMWAGNRAVADLQSQFNTCTANTCAAYQDWLLRVQARLPGVSASLNAPQVDVDSAGRVNITVYWQSASDDPLASPHRYDTSAQVRQ